jgi:acyl-CoA synthetase (AMP-forming)/AMP-acid ligase II
MPADSPTLRGLWPSDWANQTALVIPEDGSSLSYAQLEVQVMRLAEALRRGGIEAGHTVAIVLPNGLEFLAAFLAVTWARAIAAPLNPAYKVDEFRFYLEDSGARALIAPPGEHPARTAAALRDIPQWEARLDPGGAVRLERQSSAPAGGAGGEDPPRAEDVAMFLHTSGTTSRPKGVPLTHANLMASLRNIAATYALGPDDASLVVMPLFHVHGLLGATLSTLHSGGAVVVPPRFSAAGFWTHAQANRVTWYSAVPTIHQVLLARADPDDAPRGGLRFIRSCSAALAPVVLAQLEDRFGAPVLEAYGMTEASHQMTSNPLPPDVRKPGTVGRGTGVEVVILDERDSLLPAGTSGEVAIRGPNVTPGYHNNPEANIQAFTHGYFRTGDQGVLDADGYLTLTGRIKELINRGGEKISPLEVDAALMEHPAVAEAVCFGAPDAKYGEEVHAAVVLKRPAGAEEILAFCRDRLADFKVPRQIHFAQVLPRTATGKIQRRQVAASFLHPSQ